MAHDESNPMARGRSQFFVFLGGLQAGVKNGAVRKLSYLLSIHENRRPYPFDLLEALLHFVQCDNGGWKGGGEAAGGLVQALVFVQRMRDRELEGTRGTAGRRLVGHLWLKPLRLDGGVGPDSLRIVRL